MLHGAVASAVLCIALLRAGARPLSLDAAATRSRTHVLLATSSERASLAGKVTLAGSSRKAPSANASQTLVQGATWNHQDTVHVAYTSDKAVFPVLLRSMLSLSLHNSAPHLVIHLFTPASDVQAAGDLSQCFQQQLQGAQLQGGMPELHINQIKEMPLGPGHVQKVALARLFLHEWLPQVDRLVYLDVDTLVLGDVSELYAQPLHHFGAAAVDSHTLRSMYSHICPGLDRLIDVSRKAFQSGVLLMDLDKWRTGKVTASLTKLVRTYPCPPVDDQVILNLRFFGNGFDWLDRVWNRVAATSVSDLFHQKIVHFAGPNKPWDGGDHLFKTRSSFFETFREQWKPEGSTADNGGSCVGFPL